MTYNDASRQVAKSEVSELCAKLVHLGLEGAHFSNILEAFCLAANEMGIAIMRAHVTLRATHPEFGSIAHRWERDAGTHIERFQHRYSPRQEWMQSPLYYLLEHDISELRQRLGDPDPDYDFPFFDELRARGATDYICFKTFFSKREGSLAVDPNSVPAGCLFSLSCDATGGFSDNQLGIVREILPFLFLALKSGANGQVAIDVADTYLGRDAGRRVLSGDIVRGSVRSLNAVICYFDLKGFTRLSEMLAGPDIIEMLNDYFGMAVDVVQDHGGNVLKFMGDGMLAIFDIEKVGDAPHAAIEAAVVLRTRMAEVNARRTAEGLPVTGFTLALHAGEVLYGNIGGKTRLDFTVIGAAVNTAARLSGMCDHVDQRIVVSADVARPLLKRRADLVSLGQYRLRGVKERQELFTLD